MSNINNLSSIGSLGIRDFAKKPTPNKNLSSELSISPAFRLVASKIVTKVDKSLATTLFSSPNGFTNSPESNLLPRTIAKNDLSDRIKEPSKESLFLDLIPERTSKFFKQSQDIISIDKEFVPISRDPLPNVLLDQSTEISSPNPVPEFSKKSLSATSRKSSRISGDLWDLVNQSNQSVNSGAIATPNKNSLLIMDQTGTSTLVRLTTSNVDTLLPAINKLGFKLTAAVPNLNFIEGYIPIAAIPQLEALAPQGLLGVLSVYAPMTSVGLVTSQADFVLEADRVRAAVPTGYDGTGVKIGVLSDSYNNLNGAAAGVTSGDLPSGLQVLQDAASGGTDEGRAMLELIHDIATNSPLAFATANGGETNFAKNIRDLADPTKGNSQIIVDDVAYLSEPFFQDGVVAQAVNDVVTNRGVSYFSSAGNLANQAYESSSINFITDATLSAVLGAANTSPTIAYYDFNLGAGTDDRQQITLNNNQQFLVSFQWDDPFFKLNGVKTDLDIFLLDGNTIVAQSNSDSIGNNTPLEILSFANTTGAAKNYDVVIANFAGPNPGRIKYVNFGANGTGAVASEYALNSSTIVPHAAAVNAVAVAAEAFFQQNIPETFTSVGPSTILFDTAGNRLATPEVRSKPDITAIDGVDNTFFGSDFDGNTFKNFFGTSAAAPNAAAVAALVKQANPTFTPAQITARLKSTATDIGAAGVDNVTGSGLINAYDAIFGAPVPTTALNFADGFETGGLGNSYETNSVGAGRIQVVSTAPATGLKNLILNSSVRPGFVLSSRNEVILRVNTTGLGNIQLSFDEKEFNDVDDPMPATFSGSNNSDGVALSVDGTNWFRLISLTGLASTSTYKTNQFNLSTFAAANSLTLGTDVRIKFQQYDVNTTDGIAFDNINVQGTINATGGDDTIAGTFGNDVINGLGGRDILTGAGGNDILTGGVGADTLTGGLGADTFVYNSVRDGIDTVTDFSVGEGDKLDFRGLETNLGLTGTGNNLISLGYLSFTNSGSNAIVSLDQDASGLNFAARSYITVNNITASALNQSGNFIF